MEIITRNLDQVEDNLEMKFSWNGSGSSFTCQLYLGAFGHNPNPFVRMRAYNPEGIPGSDYFGAMFT